MFAEKNQNKCNAIRTKVIFSESVCDKPIEQCLTVLLLFFCKVKSISDKKFTKIFVNVKW